MKAFGKSGRRTSNLHSFTLVELLTVIAIIVILMAIAIPAASSLMRSNDLNQAVSMISDEFALSRQTALTKNADVEFRLYQIGSSVNSSDLQFRAFRSLLANATNSAQAQALEKVQYLPTSVIISPNVAFSTLLDATNSARSGLSTNQEMLPGKTSPVPYVSFLFRATGGTGLTPVTPPIGIWDLTLYQETAPTNSSTGLPKNYATIQIDPVTGSVRTYRP